VENPFKSNFPAKEGYDYLGRATLILLLAVVPHLVMARATPSSTRSTISICCMTARRPMRLKLSWSRRLPCPYLAEAFPRSPKLSPHADRGAGANRSPTLPDSIGYRPACGRRASRVLVTRRWPILPLRQMVRVDRRPQNSPTQRSSLAALENPTIMSRKSNFTLPELPSAPTSWLLAPQTRSLETSSFSATWSNVATGAFVLTAVATDKSG